MFTVILNVLAVAAEDMQNQIRQLDSVISEVESVEHALQSFSGYGDIVTPLRAQRQQLIEEREQLTQMMQALEKVRRLYERSEDKIVDNAEGTRYFYRKLGVSLKKADLNNIKKVNIIV